MSKSGAHGFNPFLGFFYLGFLITAGIGNATAALGWLEWPLLVCIAVVMLAELSGVVVATFADERMQKGEKAIGPRIGSAVFAFATAALQWAGHHDHPIRAGFFVGVSLTGYVIWMWNSGARRRDTLRAKGLLPPPAPFSLWQRFTHPNRTKTAMSLMRRDSALDSTGALDAAKDHPIMLAFIRNRLATQEITRPDGTVTVRSPAEIDGILHVLEPHTLVPMFREQLGPYRDDLVRVMVGELNTKSLLGGNRPGGVRGGASDASGRSRQTVRSGGRSDGSRGGARGARTDGRNRLIGRPPADWWTPARVAFYEGVYAPTLDTTGQETGGAELAAGLDIRGGNARTARDKKLRPRYVQEVVSGDRHPRAPLPAPIAQAVSEAAGGARLTEELERMGDAPK